MNFEAVDPLYQALEELPNDPAFTYVQPNDLDGIRRERPAGPRQLGSVAETDLLDKLHGAWTGRSAGCALGKPVEGMGIRGQQGMIGRRAIKPIWKTEISGHWITISDADAGDGLQIHCPKSQREYCLYGADRPLHADRAPCT